MGILFAYRAGMKPKPLSIYACCAAALGVWLVLPEPSRGETPVDNAAVAALVADLAKQQALIAENQAKIDAMLASITEDVRVARIFAGRSGGKVK
jgi:hypothetical protein